MRYELNKGCTIKWGDEVLNGMVGKGDTQKDDG